MAGRVRVLADGGENRGREIGHRRAPARRGWSGGAAPRKPRTRRHRAQVSRWVSITARLDARVFTIEAGGDRVTDVSAAHTGSVAYEGSGVPPVSSVAVDDLTRLWLDARDGDRTSLLQAIRASQADVWRLALHLVGENEADDATQETFVRAWRALPAFRGDSSARTWLLAIARRACADSVRGAVRRRRLARQVEHRTRLRRRATPAMRPARTHSRRSSTASTATSGSRSCSRRWSDARTRRRPKICGVPVGTIRSRVARGTRAARRRGRSRGDRVRTR